MTVNLFLITYSRSKYPTGNINNHTNKNRAGELPPLSESGPFLSEKGGKVDKKEKKKHLSL